MYTYIHISLPNPRLELALRHAAPTPALGCRPLSQVYTKHTQNKQANSTNKYVYVYTVYIQCVYIYICISFI